jgi:hypothetical protein
MRKLAMVKKWVGEKRKEGRKNEGRGEEKRGDGDGIVVVVCV